MKAVVILGAGASAGFGVPTLRYVFQDRHARAHLAADQFLRRKLVSSIWSPRDVDLETSHLSLTVEEILTMLRDAEKQEYGRPPLIPRNQVERFRRSLYVLIKKAVYDGKNTRSRVLNPLLSFMRRRLFSHVTWASFNWDCMFESAFWYSSREGGQRGVNPSVKVHLKNWGISVPGASVSTRHTFLKLHGGINWWCENDRLAYLPFTPNGKLDDKWKEYEAGNSEGQPIILEPSYYKYSGDMYNILKIQWSHFVDALVEAEIVIVVGYSLPEGDTQARTALTLGFQWNRKARWVIIDESRDTCMRYERLIGRSQLTSFPLKLEKMNPFLHKLLGAEFETD